MAQDITLLGASYQAVPAVTLPKTGGGTASFTDVTDTTAAAEDVASGKYFYTAAGVRTEGTSSGGGADMTLLVDTTLTADQTADIKYDWSPGYEELHYSIYVPKDARNTVGSQELIIYTENSTANQPRFNITANANTNQLNWGHMTADLLQLIKGNVSVGGATHDATGGVTATFCQQGRTGKITRFWLLYNASRFLPSGSQIKIYGR